MIRTIILIVVIQVVCTISDAQSFRKFIDINGDYKSDVVSGSVISNDTIWFSSRSLDQNEFVSNLSCYSITGEFINQIRVETSPHFGASSLYKIGNRLFFTDTPNGGKSLNLREYNASTLELKSYYEHRIPILSDTVELRNICFLDDKLIFGLNNANKFGLLYILPLNDIGSKGRVVELRDSYYNFNLSNLKIENAELKTISTLIHFGDKLLSLRTYSKDFELIDEIQVQKGVEIYDNPWIGSFLDFSEFGSNHTRYVELNTINTWPEQSRNFGYIIFNEIGEVVDYYVHYNPYLSTYFIKNSLLAKDGAIYLYGQVGINISEDGPVSSAPLPFNRWNIYVPYIIKITDGVMDWERIYIRLDENGNNDFNIIGRLHETKHGLIALGLGNTNPQWFIEENGKFGDLFFMGVDADGCFEQDDCGEGDWYKLSDTKEVKSTNPNLIIPNPVSSIIDLSQTEAKKIELFDMSSKKVMTTKQKTLDISFLPPAAYIIVVHYDEYIETKKILKQ